MHPWRQHILFRWVAAALIVLGMAGWLYYQHSQLQIRPPQRERPDLDKLTLPSPTDMQALEDAIVVVRDVSRQPPPMHALAPDPALLGAKEVVVEAKPDVNLGLIFLGDAQRFASLNGKVYKLGQMTDIDRRLTEIERESVLLENETDSDRIWWIEPMTVSLVKPEPSEGTDEQAGEESAEAAEGRVPADVEGDPEAQEAMPQTLKQSVDEDARLSAEEKEGAGNQVEQPSNEGNRNEAEEAEGAPQ